MAAERLWRIAPAEARVAIALDSLTAVFDRTSGQTHLLASPLPEMIAALEAGPADLSALRARLAADFELADTGPDADAALLVRLEELAALGLVSAA